MNTEYILFEFRLEIGQDKDSHFKYMLFKRYSKHKLYIGITHSNKMFNNVTLVHDISAVRSDHNLISERKYTREEIFNEHPEWFLT